ncbi:tripartite tricarboxylate transporter permease [Cognatishimia activa]|uniref:tripartite tricarboxylate transporter permease n=1 Tax=Cognatishimia activa TaxID=1715691 RepID=UPI002E812E64|nr:tripartite tricarboxylate transporter permease [Cognatishimia activa]
MIESAGVEISDVYSCYSLPSLPFLAAPFLRGLSDHESRPSEVTRCRGRAARVPIRHPDAQKLENLIRSSGISFFSGTFPGAGGVISSFTSYAIAKTSARPDEKYGNGTEGGVATEGANNATVGGRRVPLLALGFPGDASSAMLLGALLIFGFVLGPILFEQQPDMAGGTSLAYMV